ncbi:MAG: flagellar biosynthesis repressor FlbT [Labrys sp. (in: a-proteobacteria)]
MALKVELKPGERIILGECVVTNHDQRTKLYIEGNVPILREKDILTKEAADTPAKRIYLAVQLMYLSKSTAQNQDLYFLLVKDILEAAPSMAPWIERINNKILTGSLYKAMKEARSLIEYEQELIDHARGAGLQQSREGHGQSS